jgi:hypothetical protein
MTTPLWKSALMRVAMPVLALNLRAGPLHAQMPFYTDDPSVTPTKTLHIEIYDEYDGLQSSQFPAERQNTANFKVNASPWNGLELDLDFPYLNIQRLLVLTMPPTRLASMSNSLQATWLKDWDPVLRTIG